MANASSYAIDGIVVEEEIVFSLSGLCQAAGASPAQVLALVDEGVLLPTGDAPHLWAFAGPSLRTTHNCRGQFTGEVRTYGRGRTGERETQQGETRSRP